MAHSSIIGIGIIGAGVIMRRHATAYRCLSEFGRLVAVADIDPARASQAKREHGFEASYTNYKDLLSRNDIDLVSICTPPQLHTPIIIDALEAGKHVLCEKPMARTLEDADKAIEVADRYPHRALSFVYQYRSDPAHQRIRSLIQSEELGRILMANVRVRAKRMPAYYASTPGRAAWTTDGGGVLINQAIHQLDALISFLGTPVEVSAAMATFLQPTEGEDTLVGWIKFESGSFATIDCTVCSHEDWFSIDVLGENAQTSVRGNPDRHDCSWELESKSEAVKRALWVSGLHSYPDMPRAPRRSVVRAQKVMCKLRGRKWLPHPYYGHTPHVRHVLESLRSGKNMPVSPREARRSLELAIALYESAITKKTVRLPIGPNHLFYRGVTPTEVKTDGPVKHS